jgi:hypothetical protein
MNAFPLVFGGRSIYGSLAGTAIETEDTVAFSVLENIRPMIETAPLEQAADAYARMMQGKARFRMVLVTKNGVAHSEPSLAAYDRTNRLVVAYSWQVPRLNNAGSFARVVTGGWRLSGVTTFQSGKPLTFTDTRNGTAYGTASRAQFLAGRSNKDVLNKAGSSMLTRVKTNSYLNSGTTLFTAAPAVANSVAATSGGPLGKLCAGY